MCLSWFFFPDLFNFMRLTHPWKLPPEVSISNKVAHLTQGTQNNEPCASLQKKCCFPIPFVASLSRRTWIPRDVSSSLLLLSVRDEVFIKHLVLTAKAIPVSPRRVLLYDWTSFSPMHVQVLCLECRNNCYISSGVFIAFLSFLNNKFHYPLQIDLI